MRRAARACEGATTPPTYCRGTGGEPAIIPKTCSTPRRYLMSCANAAGAPLRKKPQPPGRTPVYRPEQGRRLRGQADRRPPLPCRRITAAEGGGVLRPPGAAGTRLRPPPAPGPPSPAPGQIPPPPLAEEGTWRSHLPGAADPRGGAAALGEEETWRRPRAGAAGAGAPQVRHCRRLGWVGRGRGGCGSPCAPGRLRAAVGGGSAAGPAGGLLSQQVRGRSAAARARRAVRGLSSLLPGVTRRLRTRPRAGRRGGPAQGRCGPARAAGVARPAPAPP